MKTRVIFILVVSMLVMFPLNSRAQTVCTNASLSGTYTYAFQALLAPAPQAKTVNPAAAIGRVTFSGTGTLHDTMTSNSGGGAFSATVDGTYSVNADCTFTSEFGGSHQSGLIVRGGKKIRVINTDPGVVLAFTADKEDET